MTSVLFLLWVTTFHVQWEFSYKHSYMYALILSFAVITVHVESANSSFYIFIIVQLVFLLLYNHTYTSVYGNPCATP